MDGGFENIPIKWVAVSSSFSIFPFDSPGDNIVTEIKFLNSNPVKLKVEKARRLSSAFAKRVLRTPCCNEA